MLLNLVKNASSIILYDAISVFLTNINYSNIGLIGLVLSNKPAVGVGGSLLQRGLIERERGGGV